MAVTGQDIVNGALRYVSSLTPGEAIEGNEASNALTVLNEMLAAFSMEWGLINVVTVESFPLVVGQVSYTIGIGGNFNTVRPDTIFNQWIFDSQAQIRYPLKQLSDNQYNSITLNTIPSIPKGIYYDPQYPLGVIYMYPTAGETTYSLNLESYKPMAQFSALTSAMNLPGEYFKCLKLLLAKDLAPEYGYELSQQQNTQIEEARTYMKARNFKRSVANFDPGINGQGRVVGGTILDGFIS